MGRKSNVKLYVGDMTLREYLVKSLVYNSYRELIGSDEFMAKTNIKKLGTLTDWAGKRKYNITLEEIYEYGIDNIMIMPNVEYVDWLEETGRTNISRGKKKLKVNKSRSEKGILKYVGYSIGLEFSGDCNATEMTELILEFVSQDEFDKLYEKIKKVGKA